MPHFIESIFDDDDPELKFWNKYTQDTPSINESVIFEGPMFTVSNKTKKIREKFFVLTSNYFYYQSSAESTKIKAFLKKKWVRVEYFLNKDQSKMRFCLRFIRNTQIYELYVEKEDTFNRWRLFLSKEFIQSDFHSKYDVLKMIGKGSSAMVYQIEDKSTKLHYAVKVFKKEEILSTFKEKEGLMNEIEIAQSLNHKYLVKLEEIHETTKFVYLVHEFLDGGELFGSAFHRRGISSKDIYLMMKCILKALCYLSDHKIIHRDLKPENILIKENSLNSRCILKIVDFGLATKVDLLDYLYKKCGTQGYMAPEIITHSSKRSCADFNKCDVFSAGVIFYKMVCGKSFLANLDFYRAVRFGKEYSIDFITKKFSNILTCLICLRKCLSLTQN
jgi:calcium/calmodulin-dependent protein kinase I